MNNFNQICHLSGSMLSDKEYEISDSHSMISSKIYLVHWNLYSLWIIKEQISHIKWDLSNKALISICLFPVLFSKCFWAYKYPPSFLIWYSTSYGDGLSYCSNSTVPYMIILKDPINYICFTRKLPPHHFNWITSTPTWNCFIEFDPSRCLTNISTFLN